MSELEDTRPLVVSLMEDNDRLTFTIRAAIIVLSDVELANRIPKAIEVLERGLEIQDPGDITI